MLRLRTACEFRVDDLVSSIRLPLDRVNSLWAKELLTSSLALIAGGAYRVPQYYMARNTNPSIATEGWHPYHFFAAEPAEMFREYAEYRAVTLEYLAADDRCRAQFPPYKQLRPGHWAACWHSERLYGGRDG